MTCHEPHALQIAIEGITLHKYFLIRPMKLVWYWSNAISVTKTKTAKNFHQFVSKDGRDGGKEKQIQTQKRSSRLSNLQQRKTKLSPYLNEKKESEPNLF